MPERAPTRLYGFNVLPTLDTFAPDSKAEEAQAFVERHGKMRTQEYGHFRLTPAKRRRLAHELGVSEAQVDDLFADMADEKWLDYLGTIQDPS